jgi:hypothetical protein
MMRMVSFVIGLVCGHAWPESCGIAVAIGAVLCACICWWADNSSNGIFDIAEDVSDALVYHLFIPWAVGSIAGAVWFVCT